LQFANVFEFCSAKFNYKKDNTVIEPKVQIEFTSTEHWFWQSGMSLPFVLGFIPNFAQN
jgi:hypothetical protein